MKKTLIILIVAVFTVAVAAYAKAKAPSARELNKIAADYPDKEYHEGFECVDCHMDAPLDRYYLIDSEACLSCHGTREEVAERTAHLDANNVNPHRSFHADTRTECYECHQEHRPSRNYCAVCHDVDLWMNDVP